MTAVPASNAVLLAAVLFAVGLAGLLVRRSLIFMLLAVEIMLNAAGLAFVGAAARRGQPDGQVMFMLILSVAAAEVAVGLAVVLQLRRRLGKLDVEVASQLRD